MGARVFPKVGAQTGEDTGPNWGSRKEGGVGARGSEGQKIDLNVQNRSGAGSVPGSVAIGLSPGLGGGMKPQKPGEPETLPSCLPSQLNPHPSLFRPPPSSPKPPPHTVVPFQHVTLTMTWGPNWGRSLIERGQSPRQPRTLVPSRGALRASFISPALS